MPGLDPTPLPDTPPASPWARLRAYPTHPDPRTETCNWIALLVASNQPFYPLFVMAIVGGEWWVACWTFLSTPFFLAVPAVARRDPVLGRALLPLAGIGNAIVSAKAFGTASGVELFLIPISLIALFAFRRGEGRALAGVLAAVLLTLALHDRLGAPLGRFDAVQYADFHSFNAWSAAALTFFVCWSLGRVALRRG